MAKLSKNISLSELIVTNQTNLYDQNAKLALSYLTNLTNLANNILQPIRDYYNKPLIITSGFRCDELNKRIGGSLTSQHSYGEAADFTVVDIPVETLFQDIINGNITELDTNVIGQVIQEKNKWVHISLFTPRYAANGKQPFVALRTTDGKTYQRVEV